MPTRNDGGTLLAKMARTPLLLEPGCEELVAQMVSEMTAHPQYSVAMDTAEATMAADDFWDDDDEFMAWLRPYNVNDGVLTIPVHGILLNKVSIKFGSFVTGYTYIERAVERGMEDPEVRAIVFDIDSPGGEVAGNFELVEKIAAHRGEKPMRAHANDHAYSAAYSIATASDRIVMSRSGGVGSVGVVTMHIDMSERMGAMGVKVTFIYAGKHKVDGNPYEALPDSVKDRIQERIDRIYGEFVALVAENRGMDEQAVRDTEALTFDASNAVEIGFADRVGALDEELAELSMADMEMEHMATSNPKNPAASEESGQITQAQMDAAVAAAREEGLTAGATAERERTSAILDSDEAKTRPTAARALADSGMAADAAIAALGKMPEEKTEAKANESAPAPAANAPAPTPFASQMEGPQVGAEVADTKDEGKVTANTLLGSYAKMTGRDPRQKAS